MSGEFLFIDAENGVDALEPDRVFAMTGARRDEFALHVSGDNHDVLITGTVTELREWLRRMRKQLADIAPEVPWDRACLLCDRDLTVETGEMGVMVFVNDGERGDFQPRPVSGLLCVEHGGNGKNVFKPMKYAALVHDAVTRRQ